MSHDRHLLRSCADEYYLVHDGEVGPYRGDLDGYQDFILKSFSASKKKDEDVKVESKPKKAKQNNSAANKKLVAIERDISKLENKLAEIDTELSDGDIYNPENADKLNRLQAMRSKTAAKLEQRQEQWLDLADD